jgi:hypothetical protein
VFVAIRQADGSWSAPQQVDVGIPGAPQPSSLPALGVANGGKVVVVFANGVAGFEKLHAAIKPSSAAPFDPVLTVQGDTAGWKDPQLDLAPGGNGYVTVQEAKHVRAFQLVGSTFTPVGAGFPDPNGPAAGGGVLNVDEPEAGDMRGAKLAVDPTGATATAIWTESPTGGEYHFYATKISGPASTQIGPRVESTIATFAGKPGATSFSDMGSVSTGGGTTWVAYRAAFTYPPNTQIPRAIVRTFDGTTFGTPQTIDGIPAVTDQGAEYPRVAINEAGAGLGASYRQLAPFGTESSVLSAGTWSPGTFTTPGPNQQAGRAAVAIDGGGAGLIAFHATPSPASTQVQSLIRGGAQDGTLQRLSDPSFGPPSVPYTAAAGAGRGLTAFLQGEITSKRVVVAVVDLPPAPAPTPKPTGMSPGPGGGCVPNCAGGEFATRTSIAALKFRNGKTSGTVTRGTALPKLVTPTSSKRTFSVTLKQPAAVKLTVKRILTGRKKGGKCVSGRAPRASQRCTIRQSVNGSFTLGGKAGVNHVQFDGRLSKTRTLALGAYELTVVATAPGLEASPAATLRFTLKAPAKKR